MNGAAIRDLVIIIGVMAIMFWISITSIKVFNKCTMVSPDGTQQVNQERGSKLMSIISTVAVCLLSVQLLYIIYKNRMEILDSQGGVLNTIVSCNNINKQSLCRLALVWLFVITCVLNVIAIFVGENTGTQCDIKSIATDADLQEFLYYKGVMNNLSGIVKFIFAITIFLLVDWVIMRRDSFVSMMASNGNSFGKRR